MSGILGIVSLEGGPARRDDLARMQQVLDHRGPDGRHLWCEGPAGLGHLMLHTTPESINEVQPWRDSASGLVITADARIDNRQELIGALGVSPAEGSALTDSSIILATYLRWGGKCVERLLGDFAFVIWNPRERHLFCARDHLGVRPFYYFQSDGLMVFASSAQAVAAASRVPGEINPDRVADFLTGILEGVDNRCSFFRDVVRLPPASLAEFSAKGLTHRTYWSPDPEHELRLGTDEDYVDRLADVLGSAVEARLRSHKAPASMLSGGIDSSTIVVLARDLLTHSGTALKTVSGISNHESFCRESQNIRRVIGQGGLDAQVLKPADVEAYSARLQSAAAHLEDPFDSTSILMMLMYSKARESGSVAVMDGLDGDGIASLTTGYPTYLLREGQWRLAFAETRGLWENHAQQQIPLWRLYLDTVKPLMAPERFWKWRWERGYARMARSAVRDSPMAESLAHQVDLVARFREYYRHRTTLLYGTLRQAHAARVTTPYLTAAIERYGRLAAYCGVEQRHPLLDKRVVELLLSFPWRQNVRHGWSKYALRRLAARRLPDAVAWRKGADHINWKFGQAWRGLNHSLMVERVPGYGRKWSEYLSSTGAEIGSGSVQESISSGENPWIVFYLGEWLTAHQRLSSNRI